MKKYLTDPAVYMPAAIVVVTMTVWVMFNGLGPAWERWSHERRMERILVWTPEPWAITVDDFPEGTATERPADEEWLSPWGERTNLALDPWRLPGLEQVLTEQLAYEYTYYRMRGVHDVRWSLNGVSVGDTDVFSIVIPAQGSFQVVHLHGESQIQNAGVVDGESGERLEVVGVATVAGDAFVAVGTVTPVGVEPDADAVELLETLAAKVRSDEAAVSAAVVP